MSKGPYTTIRYTCPGCREQVTLERGRGHVATPRCQRCELYMLSDWELSLSARKRPRRSRWGRLLERSAG